VELYTYRQKIVQDHDDMEFMAQKLKEEYEKWGLTMNLKKPNIYV
jgi:hypothetical protein